MRKFGKDWSKQFNAVKAQISHEGSPNNLYLSIPSYFGFRDILKAANNGEYNFIEDVKEYGKKAKIMKKMFTENGFNIVYDKDGDELLADGFYFTVSYPGLDGGDLTEQLLYYGISTIPLAPTGSDRTEGIRICVSLVKRDEFPELESRLKKFHEHHS